MLTALFSKLARYFNLSGDFDSTGWQFYKRFAGIEWDRLGKFEGEADLAVYAGRNYTFKPNKDNPFSFTRYNGDKITPGRMITDGGSIPRMLWNVQGFDPWYYMASYLVHDWLYLQHHCTPEVAVDFNTANDVLAEAVYTLMVTGAVPQNWRNVVAIHTAVNSRVGLEVWNAPWTAAQCIASLG
jgi:hypothetical protein